MRNINIFLDDERQPTYVKNQMNSFYPNDWVVINNYFDFTKFVDENFDNINLISFDHDISSFDKEGKEWTGKDAADYLIDKCLETGKPFPNFFVHTMNNVGRPNIIGTILNYLKHVENKNISWKYYNSGIINNQVV
jgi:hypothetical protein